MGNPLGACLLAPLFAAAVPALGLVPGSLFNHDDNRHEQVMRIIVGTSVPLFFLGGGAWPAFMMPGLLAAFARFSPVTPAMQGFVKLNPAGASIGEATNELGMLAMLVVVCGALAWWWHARPVSRPVARATALASVRVERGWRAGGVSSRPPAAAWTSPSPLQAASRVGGIVLDGCPETNTPGRARGVGVGSAMLVEPGISPAIPATRRRSRR